MERGVSKDPVPRCSSSGLLVCWVKDLTGVGGPVRNLRSSSTPHSSMGEEMGAGQVPVIGKLWASQLPYLPSPSWHHLLTHLWP